MRQKGSKADYFWTIDPSGTCAKAVCSHLSQRQHGVGCQVKLRGCDCSSQLQKSCSQIFKLLKPLQILRLFIYPVIKHYKELWRVEDRARSECLKSARAVAAIKTIRARICWNLLWAQKIMSWKLNLLTQSSRASSGTIYTCKCPSAQKNTSLLLLWRKSDRQEQNVSSSGMPRMGIKNILFMEEKIFTIEEQYNNQYNKTYAHKSPEVRSEGAGGHHPSYVMVWWGGVPSGGDTSSLLWERCENWCPSVSRGCATRHCGTS